MADPRIDTATQRPPTGLNRGARELILRVIDDTVGVGAAEIVSFFFRDRYGGRSDYYDALERVWGEEIRTEVAAAVYDAESNALFPSDIFGVTNPNPAPAGDQALLLTAPEPDFRLAVTQILEDSGNMGAAAARVTRICQDRGVPWSFSPTDGFEYIGDEEVERELLRPALAAINLLEFSGGVRSEFESARAELAAGTPSSLKQAVHEAGCAVESAMKVVLDEHGAKCDKRDTAKRLFDRLVAEGVVPSYMEYTVLVAMTPRNRTGGHGAGKKAHSVDPDEAAAVVAGAGGALAYLATRLPVA